MMEVEGRNEKPKFESGSEKILTVLKNTTNSVNEQILLFSIGMRYLATTEVRKGVDLSRKPGDEVRTTFVIAEVLQWTSPAFNCIGKGHTPYTPGHRFHSYLCPGVGERSQSEVQVRTPKIFERPAADRAAEKRRDDKDGQAATARTFNSSAKKCTWFNEELLTIGILQVGID
jgi:hypothetical protein